MIFYSYLLYHITAVTAVTIDQAGWHTRAEVRVPEGLHLEFIPSHSPELQSAERL